MNADFLYRVGLIIVVTLMNVVIAFTCAITAMFYCIDSGWEKTPTLAVTIFVAVVVTAYIRLNHLILFRIRNGEKK